MSTVPELISFVLALLTLPWSIWFLVLYAGDGWWREWFGRSLMAIAVGVFLSCVGLILFRIYGLDYPGRAWLSVAIWALVLFGMVTRTLVLRGAQRRDRDRGLERPRRIRAGWRH